jgi:glycosyltransferase involved in cell wall biosynthesis
VNACTIIARNYLAQARVLARSFSEHHPGATFTTLVVDADEAFPEEFEVLTPAEIGLDERDFKRMAMLYDVMELATAVKPWLLRTLLARGEGPVAYFDPDIEIFEPLDDIWELAREHSIVLTPHTLVPLAHDRLEPGEVTLLRAGMFNLGFIAVGDRAVPFLDWWAERLARAGHVDPEQGQFVDQRWVDFVPSLFEHTVLRDPTCNVAHWNLETRRFEHVDGRYLVDGQPLRFFHYSGYDPDKPHLLSKFLGPEPRLLLSEHPALREICDQYSAKLQAAGHRAAAQQAYRFESMPNGVKITKTMRRLYAKELRASESGATAEPPNPFVEGDDAFLAWLNEPAHPGAPGLSRYLAEIHAGRGDLQGLFPDPRWFDRKRFIEWAWTDGRSEEELPVELLPDRQEALDSGDQLAVGGVNVAGYFRAEAGVGQAARHVLVGLDCAGIPYTTVAYDKTLSRQSHAFVESGGKTYDVNIICVNADQIPSFGHDVGPRFFQNRHSIGIWWWEVSRFPKRFHEAFQLLNEVWVGSEFVRQAVSAETDREVFTIPICLELPELGAEMSRDALGVPEGFMFLFSFDFDSRFERKNPLATIEAFTRAFESGEGPVLYLKTINGDRNVRDLERLKRAIAGRDDIVLKDGYLSAAETAALTASCDCYVSLHRSEGFGLTMAEAMAHAKPVIATAYSGNLEFMTEETSRLVPYRLLAIPNDVDPYPAGAEWADPDVEVAARYMRELCDDPDGARDLGRRAREHVAKVLSPDRTAEFLKERLSEIWRLRAGTPVKVDERPRSGLERAMRYLEEGPTDPIRGPSRFGPLGRLFRRAVYRAIRPYTARHAEFEQAIVDALQELQEQLTTEARIRRAETLDRARHVPRLNDSLQAPSAPEVEEIETAEGTRLGRSLSSGR